MFRGRFFVKRESKIVFNDAGRVPPEWLILVEDGFRSRCERVIRMYNQMGEVQFRSFFLSSESVSAADSDGVGVDCGILARISAAFSAISSELIELSEL